MGNTSSRPVVAVAERGTGYEGQPQVTGLADGPQGQRAKALLNGTGGMEVPMGRNIPMQDRGGLNDSLPGPSSAGSSSGNPSKDSDCITVKELQEWARRLGLPNVSRADQFHDFMESLVKMKAEALIVNATPHDDESEDETESDAGDSDESSTSSNESRVSGHDPSRTKKRFAKPIVRKLAKKSRNEKAKSSLVRFLDSQDTEASAVEPIVKNRNTETSAVEPIVKNRNTTEEVSAVDLLEYRNTEASAVETIVKNRDTTDASAAVEHELDELPVPGPSRTRANYSRTAKPKGRKKKQN